ncbi:copper amine oxidase [Marinococcus halophilus]|uniref:Copper amine oxidase n=1 Tax=Marinococcus halophilus TaxID=1371 RepID=A0A510Y515_MARHA|nr:copper amine oxidase [Marinococcus halophilus]OZT80181.1 copper amine oxidase [Marinococcus halophilus]GEK58233.1 hypothetical protein MHA01_11380 [Marinococcus halophilus]
MIGKKFILGATAATLMVPTTAMAADNGSSEQMPMADMQEMKDMSAGDVRASFDQLLSEHFVLAVLSMQKQYDDAPDAEEVQMNLNKNADDMQMAITSLYGEEAGQQFGDLFREHNEYTTDIVEATKNDDEAGLEEAEAEIQTFADDLSTLLSDATGGELPQEAAEEALIAHEDDVQSAFDNYVAEDYEAAYTDYREGYARMFDIGETVSDAVVKGMPDQFDQNTTDTAADDLRSNLNMLAGEHFSLAVLEMQKGVNQQDDYDFVTWAEDGNTEDFRAAITSIYGEEAGVQFMDIWQGEHIDAQSDIVAATLEEDDEARQAAEDELKMFSEDFGAFLGGATEENLPTEAAQDAVWMHESQVLDTYDNYMNEDYEATYDSFREGYAFMFGIGKNLGGAISTQMPEQFGTDMMMEDGEMMPAEMPQTGMGGTANGNSPWAWVFASVAMTALAGAFMFRKNLAK